MITKNKTERITCQKKIILDYLKNIKTHPSAEVIYREVKKKLPRISLGTVYRNLKTLKEKGKIQEILYGIAHFDGDISPHAHFICEKCEKIFDIFGEIGILEYKKLKVGKVKNYQVYFYGLCNNCQTR